MASDDSAMPYEGSRASFLKPMRAKVLAKASSVSLVAGEETVAKSTATLCDSRLRLPIIEAAPDTNWN